MGNRSSLKGAVRYLDLLHFRHEVVCSHRRVVLQPQPSYPDPDPCCLCLKLDTIITADSDNQLLKCTVVPIIGVGSDCSVWLVVTVSSVLRQDAGLLIAPDELVVISYCSLRVNV